MRFSTHPLFLMGPVITTNPIQTIYHINVLKMLRRRLFAESPLYHNIKSQRKSNVNTTSYGYSIVIFIIVYS